jgi:hypothetical protein
VVDDLHGLLIIGPEPLLNTLDIIIRPPTRLSPLQQAVQHHLFGTDQMQDEGDVHLLAHQLVPGIQILQIPGKPVNQEPPALEPMLLHGPLQQHDGDLAGHDLALDDVLLDDLPELRPRLLPLSPQEVARGEVDELKVVLDTLALRPLAGSWPAEDEDHCGVLTHQHNKIGCNNTGQRDK